MLEINRNPAILLHFRVLIQFAAGIRTFSFRETASDGIKPDAV
ncbi:TPA: hypothetical protein ACJJ8Z_001581 [Neisseria meningitidis]